MAEKSYWWTTNGTGDGPGGQYSRADHSEWTQIVAACCGREGVAPDASGDEFAATKPGANTVRIGPGRAIVDGFPYRNSSPVDINIPNPVGGGNSRIDWIVLRTNWTAQTVRITRIAGTDAANPSVPALTQNSGSLYDVPLYQVHIDSGGTITLTDERLMAQVPTTGIMDEAVTNGKLDDDAVTPAKLDETGAYTVQSITTVTPGANAVRVRKTGDTQDRVTLHTGGIILFGPGNALPDVNLYRKDGNTLATGDSLEVGGDLDVGGDLEVGGTVAGINLATHDHSSGDGAQIPTAGLADEAVTTTKLADGALDTTTAGRAKMANGYITAAKIAADAVDDTKVGDRVPALVRRVGGSESLWVTPGITAYTPGPVRMVAGAAESSSSGDVTAPFGITFSAQPIVLANAYHDTATSVVVIIFTNAFNFSVYDKDGNRIGGVHVYWLAIGPE